METVLITGGTGLVGKALSKALLEKGYGVIILSREVNKRSDIAGLSYANWNVREKTIDTNAVAKADYIVHLAGEAIAGKRWTKKRKQEIVDSRVSSSQLIVDSLRRIPNKVKAVVSASAIGWYGEDRLIGATKNQGEGNGIRPFVEPDPPASDFLGQTCKQWENSIEQVTESGKRLVKLRIGIVLSKEGGALKEFLMPLKFGIAAILGNGKQIISWVHIADLVKMYIAAIENEKMEGVYNAVAPNPVSNKELILALAKNRKKFFIPVHIPGFILKCLLGGMSIEILKSTTVSSSRIMATGFDFNFPYIGGALP